MSAGYSATPLIKKLGIKAGFRAAFLHLPPHYLDLLGELPPDVTVDTDLSETEKIYDFIHAFYFAFEDLLAEYEALKAGIKKDGMIWISWYKKSSKIPTDISEDFIRDTALERGLVDVKVAAIDEHWSGLKLVYRKADR